jgi:hypothetical protein
MASLVDLLLSRKLVPDGPTQVTVTVRPRRVAYLIDPVDPRFAFAAISSAMYTLAGVHAFLISCRQTSNGRQCRHKLGVRFAAS